VRRVGVGASCYPYGGDCLEGLLCDFNTFRCVSGSSVPGTPCTSSCAGNSWCVNGACQPQSQRGAACVYGSCGPLDYCADPDGYGPMTGTCVEQQGASCSTTGCGQAQYCADPDGSGPLPGRCVRLLADGELCRREDSGECSSGFCSFATATIDYRCVPRLSEGDTCGPAVEGECAPSLLCLDDNRCHTLLTLGMPCGAALPVANLCAGDLTCSVATGKCEAPPSGPVVCEEVNAGECPSGLVCAFADPACDADAGACARLCRARVAAGARCKSHAECESDSCYDGKCADQVCVRKD
jgi:hypothetical protein